MARAALVVVSATVVAVLACMFGTTCAASGGMPCTLNVQCGWPGGNMELVSQLRCMAVVLRVVCVTFLPSVCAAPQLRENTESTTGSCVSFACQCAGAFTCSNCFVNGNSVRSFLSEPWGTIDVCSNPFGGGVCKQDKECGRGLCIAGKCVCYSGWTCEYCQLQVDQDILNHAQCGNFTTGNADCDSNTDCGGSTHGSCDAGTCKCAASYVCDDCSATRESVLSGIASCPCTSGQCNNHGTCSNGICTCEENWSGTFCNVDLCDGVDCNGHGTCRAGVCECSGGYTGPTCNTGGGNCASNADCGYYAPIAGLADPNSQCDGLVCVDGKYGGTCNNSQCVCNTGFACSQCTAKGTGSCEEASGGATCATLNDCGKREDGSTGGMCIEGRCLCFPGFVCPSCDKVGPLGAGETCSVDRSQSVGGANCTQNEDCGLTATGATGGSCNPTTKQCECYTGYYCPSCNTVNEPDFNAGEKCPVATGGGGECFGHDDCVNGACVSGKCMCYPGYDCEYCNARALVVGDRIPGKCTASSECGASGGPQGGECKDGECECYNGFLCSMCDKWGTSTCPPDNFVRDNDTLVCPPPPVRTGGASCSSVSDCGEVGDGLFGGQCSNSRCVCWDGYTCPDCSRTKTQLAAGMECSSAWTVAISWVAVLGALLVVTMGTDAMVDR